jgi:uncharacterized iron-regulated membrane protein
METLVLGAFPTIANYLIGALAIMAGSILFLGAFLIRRRQKDIEAMPSMRPLSKTIPPRYEARKSTTPLALPTATTIVAFT